MKMITASMIIIILIFLPQFNAVSRRNDLYLEFDFWLCLNKTMPYKGNCLNVLLTNVGYNMKMPSGNYPLITRK